MRPSAPRLIFIFDFQIVVIYNKKLCRYRETVSPMQVEKQVKIAPRIT